MTLPIESRIRWSGLLIVAGLIIQMFSLWWSHPLSFMAFLVLGCPLILVGILLFLWALASKDAAKDSARRANALVFLCILVLPLATLSCDETRETSLSKATTPAFDPSTATARVFGTVSLDGAKPSLGSVTIRQDPFCQKQAKEILKRGALVTDDGVLRNVIVYVRSGYPTQTYAVPSEPVVLDQQECVYLPHVLTVMKGQKVKIRNSDPTFHNVHAGTEFNIPQPKKGVESIQTFSHPGMPPFKIGCDFHSWMVAYAGVFEHPFHTTTGDTGKFELRLPPGKYEIAAWHEKFGEKVSTAEVAPDAIVEMNFKFSPIAGN